MKDEKVKSAEAGHLPLRAAQAGMTRARIEQALVELLQEEGGFERITFKSVAQRAGVTEMTVYRHYPTRDDLLRALWEQMNREMGPNVHMPDSLSSLRAQHQEMYAGFDRIAPQIIASLTTPQGREMRTALNRQRRKAFRSIVREIAPDLEETQQLRAAGILQLLHSAYAWDSLREQWGMSGAEAGRATQWAIDIIIQSLRKKS